MFRPFVWLFLPRIWLEDGELRWQFWEEARFTFFALLPKGKQALSPSYQHFQEAPFGLRFAGDIDRDGSDEVIGYDVRRCRWRLYRAEVTKVGELRWQDVLLGGEYPRPKNNRQVKRKILARQIAFNRESSVRVPFELLP